MEQVWAQDLPGVLTGRAYCRAYCPEVCPARSHPALSGGLLLRTPHWQTVRTAVATPCTVRAVHTHAAVVAQTGGPPFGPPPPPPSVTPQSAA